MKKLKKLLFGLGSLLYIFCTTSCVTWVQHYPDPFAAYTFHEISYDETKKLWNTYDTSTKKYDKATVYITGSDTPVKVFNNCKITRAQNGYYRVNVLATTHNATIRIEDYDGIVYTNDQNVKFYQADQDPDCIRISNGHGFYQNLYFVSGWIVEERAEVSYDDYSDYQYVYFEY